jgi:hypothetical protein
MGRTSLSGWSSISMQISKERLQKNSKLAIFLTLAFSINRISEMKLPYKVLLYIAGFLLWTAASVIIGGLFLSIKQTLGFNVFTTTGYHAFKNCLKAETQKAIKEKAKEER